MWKLHHDALPVLAEPLNSSGELDFVVVGPALALLVRNHGLARFRVDRRDELLSRE